MYLGAVARLLGVAADPATPGAGALYFHTTAGLKWYDGSAYHTTMDLESVQTVAGTKSFATINVTTLTLSNALTQAKSHATPDTDSATTALHHTLGTGAFQAAAGNDSRFTDSRTPIGNASGDLTGTYPAPTIALLAITDTKVAAANKDGLVAVPSLRTIGTGAQQAAAGNHGHVLTGAEITGTLAIAKGGTNATSTIAGGIVYGASTTALATTAIGTAGQLLSSGAAGAPTWINASSLAVALHASTHAPGGSDPLTVDAAVGTGSLRTLGTGALQAAVGSHTHTGLAPGAHASTHQPGGGDAMAVDAAVGTGSLRTLGTGALQAAVGSHGHALTDAAITGVLTIAKGGTNISAVTQGGVVYGAFTTAMGVTAAGSPGDFLLSNSASPPAWTTPSLTLIPNTWVKESVSVATTTNIALTGTANMDGMGVAAGDRILVKDQSAPAENGIWVAAAGAWARAGDANLSSRIGGGMVSVDNGTVNGGSRWSTTFKTIDTLGTTAMVWTQVGAGGATGAAGGDLTGTYPNPTIGTGKVTSTHILDGTITDADVNAANKDGAVGTASLRTLGTGALQAAAGSHGHALTDAAITGVLAIAKGGTGQSGAAVPGGVAYGVSATAEGYSAAGTSGYLLTSGGAGIPTWLVDNLSTLAGAWTKQTVKVATTANLASMSGLLTVDGVTLVLNDRVLVKDQTTQSQNGIYQAQSLTWTRVRDSSAGVYMVAAAVGVSHGTVNAGTRWTATTNWKGTDTLDTTAMVWTQMTSGGGGSGDTLLGTAQTFTAAKTWSVATGTVPIATTTPTNAVGDTSMMTFLGRAHFGYDNQKVVVGDMAADKLIEFRSGTVGTTADTRLAINRTLGIVGSVGVNALFQGQSTFSQTATGTVALRTKIMSGSTVNLFEALSSTDFPLVTINQAGNFAANNTLLAQPLFANGVSSTFKGAASQTGDLTQWQTSAAAVLSKVDAAGKGWFPEMNITAPAGAPDSGSLLKIIGIPGQFGKQYLSITSDVGGEVFQASPGGASFYGGTVRTSYDFWTGTSANLSVYADAGAQSSLRAVRISTSAANAHVAEFGTRATDVNGADTVNGFVTKEGDATFRTLTPTVKNWDLSYLPGAWTKQDARVATTANITLSGTQTIDGVLVVVGDRVLVKNQTLPVQNGIYTVASSAWARSTDADSPGELAGAMLSVDYGTVNGGSTWTTDFKASDPIGSGTVTWAPVSAEVAVQPDQPTGALLDLWVDTDDFSTPHAGLAAWTAWCTGTTVFTGATAAAITGASVVVPVNGPGDIFLVIGTFDVVNFTAVAGTFAGALYVDGAATGTPASQALFNAGATAAMRSSVGQHWLLTGYSSGNHTFALYGSVPVGSAQMNVQGQHTHFTVMRIN